MTRRTFSRNCGIYRALVLFAFVPLMARSDDKPTPGVSSSLSSETSPKASASDSSAADQSTARFFVGKKPVVPESVTAPEPKGDLSFALDVADVKDGHIRLRGWGWRLAPPHQKGDRVTILLVGGGDAYSALADVEMRPDVSAVLKQPGLDDTGFVSLIDAAKIKPGAYTIFLRIGGADGEAIKTTNRTLTL
jgi:hypothetical protein